METTRDEAKILEAARKQATPKSIVSLVGLVLGVIGGSMIILEQVLQLVGVLPNEHHALATIASGALLIGFSGVMYEYVSFRRSALSLIRKLTSEEYQ